MTATRKQLRHGAFLYGSLDEYVARAVPFLLEGLEAVEGVIVASTRPGLATMREALGQDAAHVTFIDVGAAYTQPAQVLAAYNNLFVDQLRETATVRIVSDTQVGPDPDEWDRWTAYEAVTNWSFAHLPAWIWCTYNANTLPDPMLERIWRTHPEVLEGDALHVSHHYEDPDQVLRGITPEPAALTSLRSISFGRDVVEFRERLAAELVAENVPATKILDALLAATEIAANAIQHGGGVEHVRVGRVDGQFVCEIVDRGKGFDDPAAGYLAPREGIGSGLWIARQLTRRIEFFTSPDGFSTRMWL
jgi:anti-sigma regulatory factor (Ser/Thr protein kinase)